jgi:hypothetical protein
MLLHKVKYGLNIHDDNKIFDPKWKKHESQAWIKQDISIWAQN